MHSIVDGLQLASLVWLLLVGLWSGPTPGATLVYPNGLLGVESLLALTLVVQWFRGRRRVAAYPFFWPSIVVIVLSAASALLRSNARDLPVAVEMLRVWQSGEPMVRGWLIFLAIAGRPRTLSWAWPALLGGLALHTGAAVLQHVQHVSRWYIDLNTGWASGLGMVAPDNTAGRLVHEAPRVQGLTSYINLTAAMFAAAVPIWGVPAVLQTSPGARWRLGLALGAAATVAALWYTQSRGPVLAILVSLAIVLAYLSGRWRLGVLLGILAFMATMLPAMPAWALLACGVAVLIAVLVKCCHFRYLLPIGLGLGLAGGIQVIDAYVLHDALSWRLKSSGFGDRGRVLLYDEALNTAASSPWWGVGDAECAQRVVQLPHRELQRIPIPHRNFHNQALQWAAAEGVPVAIAMLALVCWAVWWIWRFAPHWPDPFARALGVGCAVGLLAFLFCNLTDAHFWRIEGSGFFWTLLAVAIAASRTIDVKTSE